MTHNIAQDRTFDRITKTDADMNRRLGFHMTRPGRAIVNRYARELASIIAAERCSRHGNAAANIWGALVEISDDELALNLVTIGLCSSAAPGLTFGKWVASIGAELGFRGVLAVKVGMWSADMLIKLPIFPSVLTDGGLELKLNGDETREIIIDALAYSIERRPLLLPLQHQPMWARASDDAVPAIGWAQPALVSHHPSVAAEFTAALNDGRAKPVIDAINWLQGTPFTINRPILDFLFTEPGPPLPPKPPPWQTASYRKWSAAYSKKYAWNWTLQEAGLVSDWDRFCNPLRLDFRGRVNALPQFSVQREDAVRALFLFENGAPIGKDGILWLKAHVAARAGGCPWSDVQKPDRLNFEGRIDWTARHINRLLRIGNSILQQTPLQSDDLPESDERYQFAAACVELAQADGNPSFITRLPLVFDASCSGLQHLSTMMRSEEGRYANLTPSDTPTDFYQIIADQIVALLDDIPGIHHRAIVKRPVMTFFYGSTISGMTEQVLGASKDRRIKTDWRKARKIATAICEAIEATITSAKEVRTFLEKIAGAYADANKPMRWNTPLGLPILNPYYEQIIEDISYRIGGKRKRVTWCTGNTDDIRRRKSIQSVAANFIHSCDAALLHNVALATKANGIELVTIHDCFGTIAPQARRLNEILREQLIRTHEYDWLQEAHATAQQELTGVGLPAPPQKGIADPRQVLKSFFAFS